MIEPALIEEVWRAGRWPLTTRGMRRFYIGLAAMLGLWLMFVPLQLLGLLLSDDGRQEMIGSMAICLGIGLPGAAVAVVLHRRWSPEHRAEDALKASGARVTGQLLKKRHAPSGESGNIPLCSFYLFGAEGPDGVPVFARMTARNGIPLGAPATIAYDPARPGAGVVVEKRSELGRKR